jgi:hypothetical protein
VKARPNPATAATAPKVKTTILFLRDILFPLHLYLHLENQSQKSFKSLILKGLINIRVCQHATWATAEVTAGTLLMPLSGVLSMVYCDATTASHHSYNGKRDF